MDIDYNELMSGFRITAATKPREVRWVLRRALEQMKPSLRPAEYEAMMLYANGSRSREVEATTGKSAATIYKQAQRMKELAVRDLLSRRWNEQEIAEDLNMKPREVRKILERLRKKPIVQVQQYQAVTPNSDILSDSSIVNRGAEMTDNLPHLRRMLTEKIQCISADNRRAMLLNAYAERLLNDWARQYGQVDVGEHLFDTAPELKGAPEYVKNAIRQRAAKRKSEAFGDLLAEMARREPEEFCRVVATCTDDDLHKVYIDAAEKAGVPLDPVFVKDEVIADA